jgi:RNA polymerase subunit RPABC4/transcription elongation factor Spt4
MSEQGNVFRRFDMPVKNETSTRFMDEVRIISPWAFVLAFLGFAAAAAAVVFATLAHKPGVPFYALTMLVPLGIVGGTAIACYILLIGYVNCDAGRRGMSRLGWTLLAILIPNALGIVLYFVLRKPRALHCPQCGMVIELGFGFCPRCRCTLHAVCPQCQRGVHEAAKFCPYCGGDLVTSVNNVSVPVPDQG